jgi:N-acetylneuraminate synthase
MKKPQLRASGSRIWYINNLAMAEFKIGDRSVGESYPPLVIAEIGINHGGSLDEAKKLVESAVEAGAEVIKHQTHIPEDEMSEEAKLIKPVHADKSIYEIIEECSLTEDEEFELKNFTQECGSIFISTAFSKAAVDRLAKFELPAIKIGSGECNNHPLVEYIGRLGLPIILSTGMNDMNSVRKTVDIITSKNCKHAILHCTNVYPTVYSDVRLNCITTLKKNFSDSVIGLSDHTIDNYSSLGAVALGANILERHFTDTKSREGPDIACSMTPNELRLLIEGSKAIWESLGDDQKKIVTSETSTAKFAFASVVSTKEINRGEVFTEENIWVKRPGTGEITAEEYNDIVGKRAAKKIPKNYQLKRVDII